MTNLRQKLLEMLDQKYPNRTPVRGQRTAAELISQLNPPRNDAEPAPDLGAGLRAIVDKKFLQSEKHQAQKWRAVRDGAHPHILVFEAALVFRMAKLGVPMFASEVWRDEARQTELFVKGVSNARAGKSPHQYGLAVDIVHGVKGWDIPEASWKMIGHIGKELAIQNGLHIMWGGDFKSLWDPAHWELRDWKTHKDRSQWPIIKTISKKLRKTVQASPPPI